MRHSLRDITGRLPDVSGRVSDLTRRLQPPRRTGVSRSGAAGLGILGAVVGAGLMFLLDPEMGRRRRALARDKIRSFVRRSGRAMDGASRDVASRARGLVIEMRSRLVRREPGGREEGSQSV